MKHNNTWLICLRCRLNSEKGGTGGYKAIKEALYAARTRQLRNDRGRWSHNACPHDCRGGCGDPDCGNRCTQMAGHQARTGAMCSCKKIGLRDASDYYGSLPDTWQPPPTMEQSKTLYPVIVCPRWNTNVPAGHTCDRCYEMPSKRSRRGR